MPEKNRADKKAKVDTIKVEKPIQWVVPADMVALWSNNIVIQHTEDEFILTFFQVAPPILLEPTPEQMQSIESVPARAVARIVLTPEAMKRVVKVMAENYERFEDIRPSGRGGKGGGAG